MNSSKDQAATVAMPNGNYLPSHYSTWDIGVSIVAIALGAIGLFLVNKGDLWHQYSGIDTTLPSIGTVMRERGGVRHKRTQSIIWFDLTEKSRDVVLGDEVFTGVDGEATVTLDQKSTITVLPSSLVLISRPTGNDFPVLQLTHGNVRVASRAGTVTLKAGHKTLVIRNSTVEKPVSVNFDSEKAQNEPQVTGASSPEDIQIIESPKVELAQPVVVQAQPVSAPAPVTKLPEVATPEPVVAAQKLNLAPVLPLPPQNLPKVEPKKIVEVALPPVEVPKPVVRRRVETLKPIARRPIEMLKPVARVPAAAPKPIAPLVKEKSAPEIKHKRAHDVPMAPAGDGELILSP